MTSLSMRCHRHPGQSTTLRCDECRRPYCRECLVTRFITSRSSIWLCRDCAAGWSGGAWGGGGGRGSLRGLLTRYWWMVAAVALVALLSAGHPGRLLGA